MAVSFSFGCEMATEYQGDQEEVIGRDDEVFESEWDQERIADFVRIQYSNNLLEIELGEIGKEHANIVQVRDLAQEMIDDHDKANKDLMDAAKSYDINKELIPEHREKLNEFQEHMGEDDFDDEYLDVVEDLHKEAIDNLEKAAEKIEEIQLRNWINSALPVMKSNLEKVEELNDKVDGSVF